MPLNCLQCSGFKFADSKEEIPGTITSICQGCYLTNIHDNQNHMFGYVKKFQHKQDTEKKWHQYSFYAFSDKDCCLLFEELPSGHKLLDKFDKYVPVDMIKQQNLIDLVNHVKSQETLHALPPITFSQD